jgi:hypothetical protein
VPLLLLRSSVRAVRSPACAFLVVVALAASLSGCGAIEYSRQFENDLSQPVVVEGCVGCGSGREVGVGDSVPLKVEQDVVVRVTTADGTVVGCAYEPGGGSTSEPVAVRASDYQGLLCDTAQGTKR